jgi:hypothetical protein
LCTTPSGLLYPLRRTNPKGSSDPGWQRIAWNKALDTVAARLLGLASDHGPESVVFSSATPSTSAMSDSLDWVMRLRRAFGSPNLNLVLRQPSDPISGSSPLRASVCNIALLTTTEPVPESHAPRRAS